MNWDEAVERTSWDESSQIAVLLDYIAQQDRWESFEDYLAARVEEEEEG